MYTIYMCVVDYFIMLKLDIVIADFVQTFTESAFWCCAPYTDKPRLYFLTVKIETRSFTPYCGFRICIILANAAYVTCRTLVNRVSFMHRLVFFFFFQFNPTAAATTFVDNQHLKRGRFKIPHKTYDRYPQSISNQ